jgi:chromosome segregation protein
MYLKSIDIVGYKSFADKTHLDLNPGITGIIGPNGCGKSNIMESVRWCLGEMSWKSLRADSMVDVIFAGTSKRPPLGMTEVLLTFDNASQLLPVQYSEITIARRIYRSGESAYFLNKTQCRLRDIREMFLDTGLGGDGYAIIDQGGVDAMISAKPEDRRAFFEEAAGVAKYKAKREEALRKLDRVDADLARLSDSVAIIDGQVRKLDNDARRAKQYARHKEELAAMEAAHILQQMGSVSGELETIAQQTAPLQETLGARRVEMDAAGATLAALNLDKANQQNQVIDSNQKIAEVKSEIGRLEERLKAAAEGLAAADARRAECETELKSAQERQAGIGPELARADASVNEAQAARSSAQAELDSWQAEVDVLKAKVNETESILAEVRKETLRLADESLQTHRKLSTAESSWSHREQDVRRSLRELDRDLEQVKSSAEDIAGFEAQLAAQQAKSASAGETATRLEAAVSALRERQKTLSDDTLKLHADLAGARARAESLEAQGGQNPYWVGAQTCLNAGLPGMLGTVRSLIKIEDWAKPALEDLLGERLYAVVCEDSTAARAGVELLQASGQGRVRFLVQSALPDSRPERLYPPEAQPLLAAVTFDPAHEKAVRFLLEEAYTLDKALFGEHWVYGGSAQSESAQLSLSSLDEVRASIVALERRSTELSAEASHVESELFENERSLREASKAAHEAHAAERSLEGQLQQKRHTLALYEQNVSLSTQESAKILSEMSLTKEQIYELRKSVASAEESEREVRGREETAAKAVAAASEEYNKRQAGQDALRARLDAAEGQLSFLAKAFERLEEERRSLEAAAVRRGQELEDLARKKDETLALQAQTENRLIELRGELQVRENEAAGVFARLQEIERQISEKETAARALREQHDAAQTQLHQLEVQVSSLKARAEGLRTRLWEEWQLTADEARERYPQVTPDPERIETLRKRIASMGNINMAAPEEYEELFQKQQALTTQIADLTTAKEDLKTAITKINATTRENFRDVHERARALSPALRRPFRGRRGRLGPHRSREHPRDRRRHRRPASGQAPAVHLAALGRREDPDGDRPALRLLHGEALAVLHARRGRRRPRRRQHRALRQPAAQVQRALPVPHRVAQQAHDGSRRRHLRRDDGRAGRFPARLRRLQEEEERPRGRRPRGARHARPLRALQEEGQGCRGFRRGRGRSAGGNSR